MRTRLPEDATLTQHQVPAIARRGKGAASHRSLAARQQGRAAPVRDAQACLCRDTLFVQLRHQRRRSRYAPCLGQAAARHRWRAVRGAAHGAKAGSFVWLPATEVVARRCLESAQYWSSNRTARAPITGRCVSRVERLVCRTLRTVRFQATRGEKLAFVRGTDLSKADTLRSRSSLLSAITLWLDQGLA